jgi:hypothetical protein
MPASQIDRDDVLITVSIEMERMFTILTNYYSRPGDRIHARYLEQIEAELKKAFESVKQGRLGMSESN